MKNIYVPLLVSAFESLKLHLFTFLAGTGTRPDSRSRQKFITFNGFGVISKLNTIIWKRLSRFLASLPYLKCWLGVRKMLLMTNIVITPEISQSSWYIEIKGNEWKIIIFSPIYRRKRTSFELHHSNAGASKKP